MLRTYLGTFTAFNTLAVVDRGEVILNRNSTDGAGFFAAAAGYTADLALFIYDSALFLVAASDTNDRCKRNYGYYRQRTGAHFRKEPSRAGLPQSNSFSAIG